MLNYLAGLCEPLTEVAGDGKIQYCIRYVAYQNRELGEVLQSKHQAPCGLTQARQVGYKVLKNGGTYTVLVGASLG